MHKREWEEIEPLSGHEAVARKKRKTEYHTARMKGLDELDKMASMILSTAFSTTSDPSAKRQQWVQQSCVAVCKDGTDFFIGVNYLSKTALMGDQVARTVSTLSGVHGVHLAAPSTKILAGDDGKHAEMKIIEALFKKHHKNRDSLVGKMIGVSKPCCPKCKNELDILRMQYSYFHNEQTKNWVPPDLS